MLIKNLRIYDLEESAELAHDTETYQRLVSISEDNPARECQNQESVTLGWSPVIEGSENCVVDVTGCQAYMLRAVWHKRILPPAAVKKVLKDRIDEIEQATGEVIKGKRKREMADDIYLEMLPKAYQKTETALLLVLPGRHEIWIDQTSASKAEDVLTMLRKHLGTLPVKPSLWAQGIPLKSWATHTTDMPSGLSVGGDLQLAIIEDGVTSKITIRKEDLDDDDIQSLIVPREIKEMALSSSDAADFRVTDEGVIKGIRFSDDIRSQIADDEDPSGQLFLVISTLTSILHLVAS